MQKYEELWQEIESNYGKTGVTDTNAVSRANQIAVELAEYGGYMAQVFDIMQIGVDAVASADSTDTIEDIIEELYEEYGIGVAGKKNADGCVESNESRRDYHGCCAYRRHGDDWSASWEGMLGAAVCIGGGAWSQIGAIATRNVVGFFIATGLKYACMGTTARSIYVSLKANSTDEELCQNKCNNKFPKMK